MQLQAEPWRLCFQQQAFAANYVVMLQTMLKTVLRRAFPIQLMLAQSILGNIRPQQSRLQIQSDTPAPRQCLSTKASAMQALRKQSRNIQAS